MGIESIRNAFNTAAGDKGSASSCLMRYERKDDKNFQRLFISGRKADGTAFSLKSDLIRMDGDLLAAAREMAGQISTA